MPHARPRRKSAATGSTSLEGDIAERRLGLADADWERLTADVTSAFHLAAIYNLAVPLELAQRVNVDGTGNVLELCAACERLERLNYVSTAYVAGVRKGVVYEHELALGQAFKNHYESTKFQAEVWVRDAMDEVPTTIYRPAIVVGDSGTGETQKFDGPYYMLRVISFCRVARLADPAVRPRGGAVQRRARRFRRRCPARRVTQRRRGRRNAAPRGPRARHRERAAHAPRDASTRAASRPTALPPRLVETSLRFEPVRNLFAGAPRESIRYLNHPVRFDTRRAGDLLAAQGLRCPRFDEYVGAMVRFYREHEDDPDVRAFLRGSDPL